MNEVWVVVVLLLHFGSFWPSSFFFCHVGVWSSPSDVECAGSSARHQRMPFTTAFFKLCTAAFFNRRNCLIPPPTGRTWTLPFIREYVSYVYCDVHCSSRSSWIAAVSGHCGNSLASVKLKESSLLVVHILDQDGFNVIVAPTQHQVWYRGQFFKLSANLIPATVAYSFFQKSKLSIFG